jgi:glycerol-3-phosphate cytidylyltransferase
VTTDELCFQRKKKYPIVNQEDRVRIVEAIRFVDEVVLQTDMDKMKAVEKYGCDAVFVGSDWKGTPQWDEYERVFNEVECAVVYLKHTDGISSTILRDKLNNK